MKRYVILIMIFTALFAAGCSSEKEADSSDITGSAVSPYQGKKILYIDSYHQSYEWSKEITNGIKTTLEGKGIELKIHSLDTKNNPSEEFKQQAALEAKNIIEEFQPDVLIVSDDNAMKYIVQEYYKDAELPVVFCGVNWDASGYDAPYSNTAGMVEVVLIDKAIEEVSKHANGNRVGFLTGDLLSEHKNAEYFVKYLDINLQETSFVKNFEEWKNAFLDLQEKVDIIIMGVPAGIENFNEQEAEDFILENVKIPIVIEHDWLIQYALLSYSKIAKEQGEWSAETALRILDGENAGDIPVVQNKKGKIALNLKMAEKLGITFSPELLKNAETIYKT
ncbi:ABC transporter substrate-binding protein [Candidatus Woesearchaeota archaeon]|nr:ABC transporter substrate-binding protein [Candidatus Woesearchaeota archaeon]